MLEAARKALDSNEANDNLQLKLAQTNDVQHLFEQYRKQIDKECNMMNDNICNKIDEMDQQLMNRKDVLIQKVNEWKENKLKEILNETRIAAELEKILINDQKQSNDIMQCEELEIKNELIINEKFKTYKNTKNLIKHINDMTDLIDVDLPEIDLSKYGEIISNKNKNLFLSVPNLTLSKPIYIEQNGDKMGYKLKLKWIASQPLVADNFIIVCSSLNGDEWESLKFKMKNPTDSKETEFETQEIDAMFGFDKVYKICVKYNISDPVNLLIESNVQQYKPNKEVLMKLKVNLSIFKQEKKRYYHDECRGSDKWCGSINRLTETLKYYSKLDIIGTDIHRETFIYFLQQKYKQLLDDNNHLIMFHNNKLQDVKQQLLDKTDLKHCKMSSCRQTSRHFRDSKINDLNGLDATIKFYIQIIDSLHFYLFHCFDGGFRVNPKQEIKQDVDDIDDDKKNVQCFDEEFDRINKVILEKSNLTKSFQRFSSTNNKYNINTQPNEKNSESTLLDEMYNHLLCNEDIKNDTIEQFMQFVNIQHYDTESIQYDCNEIENGNICILIGDKTFSQYLSQFLLSIQISSCSFSIGYRFYYWDYYKSIKHLDVDETIIKVLGYGCVGGDDSPVLTVQCKESSENINDHSGYFVCDLFVIAKYSSFKEEISNYTHLSKEQYEEVIVKTKYYMDCEVIKSMKAINPEDSASYGHAFIPKHYGIRADAPIYSQHIMSLLFYTDWTELSSDFSLTFRKKRPFESLENIKKRNSAYFYMSKYLRELVEIYGLSSRVDGARCYGNRSTINGPFYTGMSFTANIPQFTMRVCSPTSTTMQIVVAAKFAGHEGIIISLDNPKESLQHCYLRLFNCSFLSMYHEEDERLLFGGFHRAKIVGIQLVETAQNFASFTQSLWYFDTMVSGAYFPEYIESQKDVLTIKRLMKKENKYDCYIHDTFHALTHQKNEVVLDLPNLFGKYEKLKNLIMYPLKSEKHKADIGKKANDFSNLFKKDLFRIFPNIKTMVINTVKFDGSKSYSISFTSLLSLISSIPSLNTIIIKAKTGKDKNYNKINWIIAALGYFAYTQCQYNGSRTKYEQIQKSNKRTASRQHQRVKSQNVTLRPSMQKKLNNIMKMTRNQLLHLDKKKDLWPICVRYKLSKNGNKADIVDRILNHIEKNPKKSKSAKKKVSNINKLIPSKDDEQRLVLSGENEFYGLFKKEYAAKKFNFTVKEKRQKNSWYGWDYYSVIVYIQRQD